jgi:hypothetical protein
LNPIDHIFFVLNDAICNSLSSEIIQYLSNQQRFVDDVARQAIFKFENEYRVGKYSKEKYFEMTANIFKLDMVANELEKAIISRIKPTNGILKVLTELQTRFSLTLFSQFSPELLHQVSAVFGLKEFFPEENILYAHDAGLADQSDSLFQKLISMGKILPGKCIWVDSNSRLTSISIRSGVDAIVFLDSEKLRREIALRRLLPELGSE